MRIAMVSEHASPIATAGSHEAGGQNVHVHSLSTALSTAGHDVRVYTRRDAHGLAEEVRTESGYTVFHVPVGPAQHVDRDQLLPHMRDFGLYCQEEWADDWRPDVVHAHYWMSGLAAHVGTRQLGIPVVMTFHALGAVKQRYIGSADSSPDQRIRIERSLAISSDRVIASCVDEVSELMRMGMPRKHATIVPCGVDIELFHRLGDITPKTSRFRIVVVGRLVPRKGIDTVIEAIARVPETELLIAGGPPHAEVRDDPEAGRLAGLASRLGVSDRVFFMGAIAHANLPSLYRSADVVVCVPWYEPFGMVPLEAMACGKPVIASAVGGLIDTVVDGVTGILVPPRRPDLLAVHIHRLMHKPFERQAMGMAATDRAAMRYSWDRVAAETVHVYEECTRSQEVSL